MNGAKNMYDDDDDDTDNDRMSSKCMQRNGKHVKGKPWLTNISLTVCIVLIFIFILSF